MQEEILVARDTTSAIDLSLYREAKRLHRLHEKINPHCARRVYEVYDSVLKLAQNGADKKDAHGRRTVHPKKA